MGNGSSVFGRLALGAGLICLAFLFSGCSSSPSILITEEDDRSTKYVAVGTTIHLELHKAIYENLTSSAPKVVPARGLELVPGPTTRSEMQKTGCFPDVDCDKYIAKLKAESVGATALTVHIARCWQMFCKPRDITITVIVRPA